MGGGAATARGLARTGERVRLRHVCVHVRRLPAAEPPGAVLAGRHADVEAEDLLLHPDGDAVVHRIKIR